VKTRLKIAFEDLLERADGKHAFFPIPPKLIEQLIASWESNGAKTLVIRLTNLTPHSKLPIIHYLTETPFNDIRSLTSKTNYIVRFLKSIVIVYTN